MFQTLAASLGYVHSCSRAVLQRWILSVSSKYTGMKLAIKSFLELHSHTLFMILSLSTTITSVLYCILGMLQFTFINSVCEMSLKSYTFRFSMVEENSWLYANCSLNTLMQDAATVTFQGKQGTRKVLTLH
jgi:hypothetical protein